ncbi:MAG: SDR family oxidoreductase [Planctomycetota bacterium]
MTSPHPTDPNEAEPNHDIAVVGMAARVPGADDVDRFWAQLVSGTESIVDLDEETLRSAGVTDAEIADPNYVRRAPLLSAVDLFDASFFGLSPKEAAIMDPQHRIFLETAWEALERSAHDPARFDGAIGVFAGCGPNLYYQEHILTNPTLVAEVGRFLLRHTGNDKDFLATRAAYCFGLTGPAIGIQTACSTSLVAIHTACQSLISQECDLALAGGVTIELPHGAGYRYQAGEILSEDGRCRSFDHRSRGTIFGSGAGVVALKRLDDAIADRDPIHAVVIGSAIDNDGASKVGYLAPSVEGQARCVAEAIAVAGIEAIDLGFVEAHGTGTPVGDPIEVTALTEAFRTTTDETGFCLLGSVKSNIGHLDTAAGVAAFIKATGAVKHGVIPPTVGFEAPNPDLQLDRTPFVVSGEPSAFPADAVRRAGVNSIGVGGTNAHVIVEEPPLLDPEEASTEPTRSWHLAVLSAKSRNALSASRERLAEFAVRDDAPTLREIAWTLATGRAQFGTRFAASGRTPADWAEALQDSSRAPIEASERSPEIVFQFPGGGAQYPNMGVDLYRDEPTFAKAVDEGCDHFAALTGFELKPLLYPSLSSGGANADAITLDDPRVSLAAVLITEVAAARLFAELGIEPTTVLGHSLGEYTAAHLAGVFDYRTALSIVAKRGELFATAPDGRMLNVALGEAELRAILDELSATGVELDLAAVNADDVTVASGSVEAISRLEEALAARDLDCTRIHIDVAAHSRQLDGILDAFRAHLETLQFSPPSLPVISNRTGTWAEADAIVTPEYWVAHMRGTVRYADGVTTAVDPDRHVLVEVGPGSTLTSLAKLQLAQPRVVQTLPHARDEHSATLAFGDALGALWCHGVEIDPNRLDADPPRRVTLPTYAFDHRRHWIEPGDARGAAATASAVPTRITDPEACFRRTEFVPLPLQDPPVEDSPERWLIFHDRFDVACGLSERLEALGHEVIHVEIADAFVEYDRQRYGLRPAATQEYRQLFDALEREQRMPSHVVHAWSITEDSQPISAEAFDTQQDRGFYSVLALLQTMARNEEPPARLTIVTAGTQSVAGGIPSRPEQSLLVGPALVAGIEIPGLTAQLIDLESIVTGWWNRDRFTPDRRHSDQELLLAELTHPPRGEVLALRRGLAWRRALTLATLPKPSLDTGPIPRLWLHDGGRYLVTGGLGGVGLRVAEHLARSADDVVIGLVGRTGLPARDRWDDWLDGHDPRDPVSRRIEAVQALEAQGATVEVIVADVAQPAQVASLVTSFEAEHGPIHGVVHAAGVIHDEPLALKSRQLAERVIGAKVKGALAFGAALAGAPRDFFVLFGSTSALTGLPGQIDYAAANAFLGSYASHYRSTTGTPTVAIDWGPWSDVGMTASTVASSERSTPTGPLPDFLAWNPEDDGEPIVATGELSSDHWTVAEHRVRVSLMGETSGARTSSDRAILPGTVGLVIAATLADGGGVQDAIFPSPLAVPDGSSVEVRAGRSGDSIAMAGRADDDGSSWQSHLEATVLPAGDVDLAKPHLPALETGRPFEGDDARDATSQSEWVAFGPRWACSFAGREWSDRSVATLTLPRAYAKEAESYAVHPALLDVAIQLGVRLGADDHGTPSLYAPISCGSIVVRGRCRSRVEVTTVVHHADHESITFDLTLCDPDDAPVLVAIRRLTLRRLASGVPVSHEGSHVSTPPWLTHPTEACSPETAAEVPTIVTLARDHGIRKDEGLRALDRILYAGVGPQVAFTTIEPTAIAAAARPDEEGEDSSTRFERPDLDVDWIEPRNETERRLAALFGDLLGVDRVGVQDDFFALGGHSLVAVRLFARIARDFGIELSLGTLFEAPTVETLARRLEVTEQDQADRNSETGVEVTPSNRLVPIQSQGDRPPFFCVHGQGGHVLMLYDLALRLGDRQPFYGIAARGIDGDVPPHETVDAMVEEYIEEIRRVQPEGPYCLGGYSGGGILAYAMAQKLERDGHEVALVALLDTYSPTLRPFSRNERLQRLVTRFFTEGPAFLLDKGRSRIEKFLRRWRAKLAVRSGDRVPTALREAHVIAAFTRALAAYPIESYAGRVALFRASDLTFTESFHVEPETLGWSDLVTGHLSVHEIPGDHNTICLEPRVQFLAEELTQLLAEARVPTLA